MVADVAVAFVWVLINAVFVVFPFPGGPTVANQFGYLAIANGMYAVIPATRNSLSSLLLGVHFDHTIMYHRWVRPAPSAVDGARVCVCVCVFVCLLGNRFWCRWNGVVSLLVSE